MKLLSEHRHNSLVLPQILSELDMRQQDKAILQNTISDMRREGLLIKTSGGRIGLPDRLDHITGTLQGNRRGFAFLRPDRQREDIYISSSNLNDAAHGDRVMVRLDQKKGKRRREGTVIGILKQGQRKLVGTLQKKGKRFFVVPDDQRYPGSVQVSPKSRREMCMGDKVVVEVEEWSRGKGASKGRIIEHIGPAGTAVAEERAFSHRFALPGKFPPAVLKELESLPEEQDIASLAAGQGRKDLRQLKMVTIDDETARDFDDAVSLEINEKGGYRLGVHIADVSHYVRGGKAIDREALKRGTSIYLVERVIHMLPTLLSEKMCSLQSGKERLAVSVLMDIDREGNLDGAGFFNSLIKVDERLTYQQVEAYFGDREQANLFADSAVAPLLDQMSDLAEVLRKRRLERGALDLDLPEARIRVDEEGVPLSIDKRTMGRSESLIEEFMIYCNETVASYLTKKEGPCMYRVHAIPTAEKLSLLRETLALMGLKAVGKMKTLKPKHLKDLLEQSRGEKTEKLVRYLVLRSLPQARYSAVNEGHYGLASSCYCHFTSPIRRYPDLVVHRILKQHIASGGLSPDRARRLQARLPSVAQQSSERERAAVEAERASMDIKKAEYMEQKIGEEYPGIINGVTNFGIFVELDNTIEGMIPINDLKDDYYVYNERAAALVGERTRKTYRLGDSIEVIVQRADREEGKVTFGLVEKR